MASEARSTVKTSTENLMNDLNSVTPKLPLRTKCTTSSDHYNSSLVWMYLDIKRVNWIYAIATFTTWRNAITKTRLRDMPLQLFYTSIYAIIVNTIPYTPIILSYIHL
jgi:hypothetical protein